MKRIDKARLGAIGEENVVSILLQHDWDAFNANCTIKNFKSIDVICLNPEPCVKHMSWKPEVALIQVKTSVQANIPIGFTIEQCLNKEYLEMNVKGPYVFVLAKPISEHIFSFRYFIISRRDFIELEHQVQCHYVYNYHRKAKEGEYGINGLSVKSIASMKISWLMGESENATDFHEAFNNPLKGVSCENAWDNIWKD